MRAPVSALALRASEEAAFACGPLVGKHDKLAADAAAVAAMKHVFLQSGFTIEVAVGEGELDTAPMLNVGERIGAKDGVELTIAVDPLEGTSLCARGLPGAVTVLVIGLPGGIIRSPDGYMNKIMAGPECPAGLLDIDLPATDNVLAYAKACAKPLADIGICMLDKPRHAKLIQDLRELGVRVRTNFGRRCARRALGLRPGSIRH